MSLLDRLRAHYESEGRIVLFRCSECGFISLSLGSLHSHCEQHRGYTRWNLQVPFTETSPGDYDALMDLTEVIAVEDTSTINIEEVEGL